VSLDSGAHELSKPKKPFFYRTLDKFGFIEALG
jgi:hypothetical protein